MSRGPQSSSNQRCTNMCQRSSIRTWRRGRWRWLQTGRESGSRWSALKRKQMSVSGRMKMPRITLLTLLALCASERALAVTLFLEADSFVLALRLALLSRCEGAWDTFFSDDLLLVGRGHRNLLLVDSQTQNEEWCTGKEECEMTTNCGLHLFSIASFLIINCYQ